MDICWPSLVADAGRAVGGCTWMDRSHFRSECICKKTVISSYGVLDLQRKPREMSDVVVAAAT